MVPRLGVSLKCQTDETTRHSMLCRYQWPHSPGTGKDENIDLMSTNSHSMCRKRVVCLCVSYHKRSIP